MGKYTRNCPQCGKEIQHTRKKNLNVAIKTNRLCRSCSAINRIEKFGSNEKFIARYATSGKNIGADNAFFGKNHTEEVKQKLVSVSVQRKHLYQTPEFRRKISEVTCGEKNPMHGRSIYDIWLKKYGKAEADKRLDAFKNKQSVNSSGENNPMYGKPSPQGSGNGWSGWYGSFYFRSLKELSYVLSLDKNKTQWISAESLRILYVSWDGKKRTYTPDFLVGNKILVEIKPNNLKESKVVRLKQEAAERYCLENNLEYQIIDPPKLSSEEINFLRSSGKIKFLDRYEKLYQERYKNAKSQTVEGCLPCIQQ